MKLSKLSITGVLSGLGSVLIVLSTNPNRVSVGVMLLPPLLLFYAGFVGMYQLLGRVTGFRKGKYVGRRTLYSLIAAGFPVCLLVLQSINQLTVKDVLLFGLLVALLGFYSSRFRLISPSQ